MHRVFRSISMTLLLVAIAAGLSACGSGVRFVRMDATEYPARDKYAPVEVFEGSVVTPHVVIGTLSARRNMDAAFNDRSTYDDLVASLKDYARKVGADALTEVKPLSTRDRRHEVRPLDHRPRGSLPGAGSQPPLQGILIRRSEPCRPRGPGPATLGPQEQAQQGQGKEAGDQVGERRAPLQGVEHEPQVESGEETHPAEPEQEEEPVARGEHAPGQIPSPSPALPARRGRSPPAPGGPGRPPSSGGAEAPARDPDPSTPRGRRATSSPPESAPAGPVERPAPPGSESGRRPGAGSRAGG